MEKPNLIILTVGTSLLMGNKGQYGQVRGGVLKNLPTKTEESIKEELNQDGGPFNIFLEELLGLNHDKQINKRGPRYDSENNPDNLPAELSSLYLFYFTPEDIPDPIPSKEPKDKVALLYSPDNKCIFCAYCIKKYLTTKFSGMVDSEVMMKKIDGLDPKDKKRFEKEGMRNLLGEISRLINDYKDTHNIILNVTGGYKGAVPYLTLLGMCQEGIEVIYLFEESKENITLPKMPVVLDLFTWRNYRGFVRAMPHLEADVAKLFLDKILPAQIGGLFEEDKLENEYCLTTLGEALEKKYDEEKEGELTPYGRGYLLVDKIHDKHKRKALHDCINRWQYLWLGDMIPETVEHARGHTQRVLELAAQILYPILSEDENFFGDNPDQRDNNLLALISAIWLHDLGHSGDHILWKNDSKEKQKEYEIKGFPSLIRELHHMLSWYLIDKDRNKLFEFRDKNNKWVRDTRIFSNDLIESIRLICLYHRGGMPVLHNEEKRGYVGLSVKESLEELRRDHVNIPLLGALLRIADGGDVQEERTISPNYRAMRDLQTDRELKTLKKEEGKYREKVDLSQLPDYLRYLKETARKYRDGEPLKRDEQYEKITNISEDTEMMKKLEEIKKENKDHCNDALLDYLTIKCIQNYIQGEGLNDIGDTKIVLRNWLSALDQYAFKKSTESHFKKHGGISAVMYLPDKPKEENSKKEYHYKVLAIHKEGKDDGEMDNLIENVENVLTGEIKKEYEKVKDILNENHIYFDSYGMMKEGKDEDLVWP